MGDFSRDTFKLTNVMHQLLSSDTVPDPKHYVSVRMQQGVPLLDSDFNESDEIRKAEVHALLRDFIGDGVPSGNDGFGISSSGIDNDFAINKGIILARGAIVINDSVTTYLTQKGSSDLPALTDPPGGVDRVDIIYLDTRESEIGAEDSVDQDSRIKNELVGIETCRRILRNWRVRVAEGVSDPKAITVPDKHHITALAKLERRAGSSAIRASMIIDLRKCGITLAENLKIPIDMRRGTEILDSARYAAMMGSLHTTLFQLLVADKIPYNVGGITRNETFLLMGIQNVINLALFSENQSDIKNVDNDDAFQLLNKLFESQKNWVKLLIDIGNVDGSAETFIDEYTDYLDGDGGIRGLQLALSEGDLLRAVIAQEDLNLWLKQKGDQMSGSVNVFYRYPLPANEPMTAGNSYTFYYEAQAAFTSPNPVEQFQVQVILPPGFGIATPNMANFDLMPPTSTQMIEVTVVPSGSLASGDLDVSIFATNNASVRSPQPPIILQLNQLPPAATFFFYAGPRFNINGELEIRQSHLTRAEGRNIIFRVQNTSSTETRTFGISGRIVPNVADTTGWEPLADRDEPDEVLAPSTQNDVQFNVKGPDNPADVPVGTTGQIIVTATHIGTNGTSPPTDPLAPITITVDFLVTS